MAVRKSTDLQRMLHEIDHRGYPAYKELKGAYDFGEYVLSIDHVQGDPFAAPSRVSVEVPAAKAHFPAEYSDTYAKRVTLQDHLTRLFGAAIRGGSFQAKGSGKSGLLSVSRCGQEVLERTACRVEKGNVRVRFEVGFPANGRTINAGELEKILFRILPDCVRRSLYFDRIDQKALRDAIWLCEDQQTIRRKLTELGLCAFVADGAVLPRQSGVSEKPMEGAVLFRSPESLRVTLSLPHRGDVTGMGIPNGVTLLVGGGYHGKSTVLQALQDGVYNHIGGDGRELVITRDDGVKLRAEDGRSILDVDISPFINHLPGGRDTKRFSTQDASGSTSQAAGLMEAVESGAKLLLIDEDTSATNFMIRDRLMQQVVSADEEPITPFVSRVVSLYRDLGISTILVAGSSGSYFHVADRVIQMKEYVPADITESAKAAAARYESFEGTGEPFPAYRTERILSPDNMLRREDRLKIKTLGRRDFSIARNTVELRNLEQLKEEEQTRALAYCLEYLELRVLDGKKSVSDAVDLLEKLLAEKGLEGLFGSGEVAASLARPRRQEIFGCLNRYRPGRIVQEKPDASEGDGEDASGGSDRAAQYGGRGHGGGRAEHSRDGERAGRSGRAEHGSGDRGYRGRGGR